VRTWVYTMSRTNEAAFETVIEAYMLQNGYVQISPPDGFDRDRAIFPDTVLASIRETMKKERDKLDVLEAAPPSSPQR